MSRLFKVRGSSMEPTLSPGDVLILRRREARIGDVVVVDHPQFGVVVKRLGAEGALQGDSRCSTPTNRLGTLQDATLIGVAVLAITPSGLRRLKPPSASRAGA